MTFPQIPDAIRLERLRPPAGRVRMVLDTDTYNETDDQFALVHALLSPERLAVEAVYAAPFHNERSDGPGHGMELSYQEILRLLQRLGRLRRRVRVPRLHRLPGRRRAAVRVGGGARPGRPLHLCAGAAGVRGCRGCQGLKQ